MGVYTPQAHKYLIILTPTNRQPWNSVSLSEVILSFLNDFGHRDLAQGVSSFLSTKKLTKKANPY